MKDRILNGMKGIVSRRPSALHPLDGLRAIAILWIFILHSIVLGYIYAPCLVKHMSDQFAFLVPALMGDLGVDVFFVLSGFLIGYILLKEHAKHDDLDIWNFYRGRFLRIWPVLALYMLFITFYVGVRHGNF